MIKDFSMQENLIASVILILVILVFRYIVQKSILKWRFSKPENRRRWLINLRNFCFLFFIIGVVLIWGTEIKTFAFSVAAVAAAFVLATKEVITCVTGGLVKVSNDLFAIGDVIQVNGFRGEVIDHTFLSTKMREMGPGLKVHQYSGNVVRIPNAWFLTHAVLNESGTGIYSLHTFDVNIGGSQNLKLHEQALQSASNEVTLEYLENAREYLSKIEQLEAIHTPSVEPKITIQINKFDDITLICRIVVPARNKGKIQQNILRQYLEKLTEV